MFFSNVNSKWIWGLPMEFTFVLIGLHLVEQFHVVLGLGIVALYPILVIVVGMNSVGQVLVGLVIGSVLHVYFSRTPLFMRIVDSSLNFVAGVIVLPLVGHFYANVDFSFAVYFIQGMMLQVLSALIPLIVFTFKFLWIVIRKRMRTIQPEDLQFMNLKMTTDDNLELSTSGDGNVRETLELISSDDFSSKRYTAASAAAGGLHEGSNWVDTEETFIFRQLTFRSKIVHCFLVPFLFFLFLSLVHSSKGLLNIRI